MNQAAREVRQRAAGHEATARDEATMSQAAREVRERAAGHDATARDEAMMNQMAWKMSDQAWEKLWKKQRWEHAWWSVRRDPWTTEDIRKKENS